MNEQNGIKTVQIILKTVHWGAIIFLCLWVLMPILRIFIPLEFVNNSNGERTYTMVRFYGLPIAATLLILTGVIKRKHTLTLIMIKVILAICVAVFSTVIAMIALLGSTCAWTVDKVLFENKQNISIKIVQRNYDCGATDSSRPNPKIFKVREITPDFIWATKIDTTEINKNEWIRTENKE